MSRQRFPWAESLVILALTGLPYILAVYLVPEGYSFGGFLFNPIDGNSYLAKMYQGFLGAWQFRLPYTASSQPGPYLFLFYLALGHLSRVLELPLGITFHLARLIASVGLMLALWRFLQQVLGKQHNAIRIVYIWTLLGSGLGWLGVAFGQLTADFVLAEGYPFLSMYTNPHFPVGIALLLLFFTGLLNEKSNKFEGLSGLYGFLLGAILPFGVVVGSVVAGVYGLWKVTRGKRFPWNRVLPFGLVGGAVLGYEVWSLARNPLLQIWNAQNQTPSPTLWNYLIAFSPALLLAVMGLWASRDRHKGRAVLCVIWVLSAFVLAYLPFNLQRRMLVGICIPLVVLAGDGIAFLWQKFRLNWWAMWLTALVLSLPTNGILIVSGLINVQSAASPLVLYPGEREAYHWIEQHTVVDSIILAAPETGTLIPAYTGRRVLYGHPFETADAEAMQALVIRLLKAIAAEETTLGLRQLQRLEINYIFWGPREEKLTGRQKPDFLVPAYQNGDISIYRTLP